MAWGESWVPNVLQAGGAAAGAWAGSGTAVGAYGGGALGWQAGTLAGGLLYGDREQQFQMEMLRRQEEQQREFAKFGLGWRIEDAERKGISPLAAIGASGASYTPVSVGENPYTLQKNRMAQMGQDISRALDSTQTEEQRGLLRMEAESKYEDIKGKRLDNEMRALELRKATNPPMPGNQRKKLIPGQGDAPSTTKIHELRDYYKSPQGGYGALLSGPVKSAVEDTPREWAIDVRDMAHQQINPDSDRFIKRLPPARKGMRYSFNYPTQEYIEVPKNATIWERMGRHSSYMWK